MGEAPVSMRGRASSAIESAPVVQLARIHKAYGGLEVIRDVSLSARRGDVTVLIGASGSGKSTLLRCINLLEVPCSGSVAIDGEEIALSAPSHRAARRATDPEQLRRIRLKTGMVFQSFNLWAHMTVLENVIAAPVYMLGRARNETVEQAESLLDKVGLYDRRHSHPAFLSGGQQQRAAIARALAVDPKVMLFDEPTSALDPELVGEVLRVIRGLAEEGRTMLLVTHEMAFARDVASHVVFLHGGQIDQEGSPSLVFGAESSARCRQFINAGGAH